MRAHKLTNENILYGLAFLLGLCLRFIQLGAAPLSDAEAGWALQALHVARGESTILGAQPAYIALTSQLFSILGDTTFLARFLPALAGSLLVWLPFFFRRWMVASSWMNRMGVVMAFGLAIDPGLVSLSRQAGSLMPALAFTLLGLACLYNRRMVWTGVFAGLAVLSGPSFLQGLLILAVSWGLYQLVRKRNPQPPLFGLEVESPGKEISSSFIKVSLVAMVATLFVAGTLFLRLPEGLAALAGTIPAYLEQWVKPSGIPVLRLPASLLVYQPLVIIFAMIAVGRACIGNWEDPHTRQVMQGLSIWAGLAIILPMFYAGRLVGDMAWALVPLWALAAGEISRSLTTVEENTTNLVAAGLALLLFVLSVVGWFNLLSIGRYQVSEVIYWAIIIGALLLGFIAILLVAATWSTSAARLGIVWSLCVVLGLLLFSNSWGIAIVRGNSAQEFWSQAVTTGQADQLNKTLSDLSSRNTGLKDQLQIISLVDSPALTWELRHFPNARFKTGLSSSESPPVVITWKDSALPSLAENYRGQDFVWRDYPGWQGVFPPNFVDWLAFRKAPMAQDQVIVWARVDTFPGGTLGTSENAAP